MPLSTASPSAISEDLRIGLLINIGLSAGLGLIVNSLLLWVLFKIIKKGSSHEDIKLCAFIAVTDILTSTGLIFRAIFAKYPYNIFKEHPYWCKFNVSFTTTLLVVSGYSLGVMSLQRFFLICFNIKFSILFWFGLIGLTWVSHFILIWICMHENLQVITWTETMCAVMPLGVGYDAYILSIIYFLTSFACVIVGYCGITIAKFRQCLNQINLNVPKAQVYAEFRSTLIKSLINIAIYICCFSGECYILIFEFSTGLKRTILMDLIINGTIVYSVVVNALILLYMNQEVRKSFIHLLKDIKSKFIK